MSVQLGIVVAVDGSAPSNVAVEWAARDAEMRNVPLKVVHVVPPLMPATGEWSDVPSVTLVAVEDAYSAYQEKQAGEIIETARQAALKAGSPSRASEITSEVMHDEIVPALIALSDRAQMMVVGCRGRGGIERTLLGSVSSGLVHHAHCPVAVIHDEDPVEGRSAGAPVVVGVDGSPPSELAAGIAFGEASRRGVDLVALHAWIDKGRNDLFGPDGTSIEWRNIKDQQEKALAERLARWQGQYPDVVVHKVVVADRPKLRLLEQAEKAQLIVLGSRGRGGFPGMLLGSVSTGVVNSARIPVIIARAPSGHSDARH